MNYGVAFGGDRNAQKNGRQGQRQAGVDIFGNPTYSRGLHAVQCKGKDDNYDSELTTAEIDAECKKATTFHPDVKDFIIATTRPREAKLQNYCLELNEENRYPFPVNVWSWDDIEPEIAARESLLQTHYAKFLGLIEPSCEFSVEINSSMDKVAAFLTRPNIQKLASQDVLQLIHPLLYELIDNAFLHGHAGNCRIVIKDNEIQIIDNGLEFDTRKLVDIEGRQGVASMRFVVSELHNQMEVDYERVDGHNCTSLLFVNGVLNSHLNDIFEITVSDASGMGRSVAIKQAEYDFMAIPEYKKKIVINVLDSMFLGWSFASAYFAKICQLLNDGQTVVVYVPSNATYVENVKKELEGNPIVFVKRK